jgi:mono/diheme cytochrome c family protein
MAVALGVLIFADSCASVGKTANPGATPESTESQLASGAPIYAQNCATSACHGTQGEGIPAASGFKVWPLVGEEFQSRHPNAQIVFDVIRSGSERNLLALTDQQVYDAIAYQLNQNQIELATPLTADTAFRTHGASMSGSAQGGLFPPSDNVVIGSPPMIRDLPIVAESSRLRIQIDQVAEASAIADSSPPPGGRYLVMVLAFSDLATDPITVDPEHLKLSTLSGELLEPRSTNIHSAIEEFHTRTIRPGHGTVGLVVFTLPAGEDFEQLIYDDGTGERVTLALRP